MRNKQAQINEVWLYIKQVDSELIFRLHEVRIIFSVSFTLSYLLLQ